MAVAMINDRTLCAPVYLVPAVSHNHFYSVYATQDHACYNSQYRAKLWSLMEFHDDEPWIWSTEKSWSTLASRASLLIGREILQSQRARSSSAGEDNFAKTLSGRLLKSWKKMMKADECGSHWWNYDQATLCLNPVMHFNKNTNMYLYDKCRTLSIEVSC